MCQTLDVDPRPRKKLYGCGLKQKACHDDSSVLQPEPTVTSQLLWSQPSTTVCPSKQHPASLHPTSSRRPLPIRFSELPASTRQSPSATHPPFSSRARTSRVASSLAFVRACLCCCGGVRSPGARTVRDYRSAGRFVSDMFLFQFADSRRQRGERWARVIPTLADQVVSSLVAAQGATG